MTELQRIAGRARRKVENVMVLMVLGNEDSERQTIRRVPGIKLKDE
jgi:hypothetical protein